MRSARAGGKEAEEEEEATGADELDEASGPVGLRPITSSVGSPSKSAILAF